MVGVVRTRRLCRLVGDSRARRLGILESHAVVKESVGYNIAGRKKTLISLRSYNCRFVVVGDGKV